DSALSVVQSQFGVDSALAVVLEFLQHLSVVPQDGVVSQLQPLRLLQFLEASKKVPIQFLRLVLISCTKVRKLFLRRRTRWQHITRLKRKHIFRVPCTNCTVARCIVIWAFLKMRISQWPRKKKLLTLTILMSPRWVAWQLLCTAGSILANRRNNASCHRS